MLLILRRFVPVIAALMLLVPARAHEGMWLPNLLTSLVYDDMRSAGLKLTADEIYSINRSSLKDAIVLFGGGCTAEIISDRGLLLTNYHCGDAQIQSHSSIKNDYLRYGFWAKTLADELPNPGLTATIVVKIEDVTKEVMAAGYGLEGAARVQATQKVIDELISEATRGRPYKAEIKPFYYGNVYYMIVTKTFNDVRLVGAPPSSIGRFGGDTDNWEWPRHTGDFAFFRIYAGPDNQPAPFSENNQPYKPAHSLPINMDGLQEGDYTMIFGFPGRTDQYLTSYAVAYILEEQNPLRIDMRRASLAVIDAAMARNDTIRIQYAAKQPRISNAYKKWIGQSQGLKAYNALEKKREEEAMFRENAMRRNPDSFENQLLPLLEALYLDNNQYNLAADAYAEFFFFGPEIIRFSTQFTKLIEEYDLLVREGKLNEEIERLRQAIANFYKNYSARVDEQIMAVQVPIFTRRAPGLIQSPTLTRIHNRNGAAGVLTARELYRANPFADRRTLEAALNKPSKKAFAKWGSHPVYLIAKELQKAHNERVRPAMEAFRKAENQLMAAYVAATMDLLPDKRYWPDANSTLRITYGSMEGSRPRDGMAYLPYTTLDGVMAKYIPGDVEFDLPEKLIDLHREADYGPYATDGTMRVCFLGSNHTTGGNSGSPALNAWGDLVGINFDRTWESTMSDIMFNPDICRNIMVDIKYVLFVVDKLADAGHLIQEMKLINRKSTN